MRKRSTVLLLGVLASGLIATGCGSSDDDGSEGGSDGGAASVATKAELIKQGDAICTAGIEKVKAEAVAYTKEEGHSEGIKDPDQYAELNETVLLPSLQEQTDDIRALGAPSGEEDEVAEILDAFDEGIEKGEADPYLLFEGPNPLIKANRLAGEYGFKSCGVN